MWVQPKGRADLGDPRRSRVRKPLQPREVQARKRLLSRQHREKDDMIVRGGYRIVSDIISRLLTG